MIYNVYPYLHTCKGILIMNTVIKFLFYFFIISEFIRTLSFYNQVGHNMRHITMNTIDDVFIYERLV